MNNETSPVGCSHPQKNKRGFLLSQRFGLSALLSQIQTNKEDKKIIADLKKQLEATIETERMSSKILKARSKLFANSTIPSMDLLNTFTNILGTTMEELVGKHSSAIRAHYKG